jgi:TRAP-type C4-dicarboxylate transport system permease small subunit
MIAFGFLVAWFGWHVADLNSQSFSPALVLNLWWLYLASVVGGILMAVYGFIALGDVLSGRGYWGNLVGGD